MDAGHKLVLVEGLGHVVVGAEAQALDLVFDGREAGEDEDRRSHLGNTQRLQHFIAGHVRQVDVEKDDVIVVELAQIDAFFLKVGRMDIELVRRAAYRTCLLIDREDSTYCCGGG